MPVAGISLSCRFVLVVAFIVTLFAGPAAAQEAPMFSPAALDRLADRIREEITNGKIAGGVLMIQQHGKQVYLQSFGKRGPDTQLAMTPDTIFPVYSLTKAVTSV